MTMHTLNLKIGVSHSELMRRFHQTKNESRLIRVRRINTPESTYDRIDYIGEMVDLTGLAGAKMPEPFVRKLRQESEEPKSKRPIDFAFEIRKEAGINPYRPHNVAV